MTIDDKSTDKESYTIIWKQKQQKISSLSSGQVDKNMNLLQVKKYRTS